MAQFRFSDLPTELRLLIWKAALYQEAQYRLVLVKTHSHRACPTTQLISPLLSVNIESRMVAKSFYNLTLDVYCKVYSETPHCFDRTPAGKIYLSTDRDIFTIIRGHICGPYQCPLPLPDYQRLSRDYITEPISDDDCDRVQRSFIVNTHGWQFPSPLRYESRRSKRILPQLTPEESEAWLRREGPFYTAPEVFSVVFSDEAYVEYESPVPGGSFCFDVAEVEQKGWDFILAKIRGGIEHHVGDNTMAREALPEPEREELNSEIHDSEEEGIAFDFEDDDVFQ
ncbi:hypothetical protein GGS26DRAFT_595113 [Hypomontagnella submonticulosa]|nr:hypothetical protein GGS26DRAFT_595113 [Hypomontagnella submonticulosa]